jgi:ketol-acid reductoisomerase
MLPVGWETVTEALKHGGITNMMDRLNNPSKIEAYRLADELKDIIRYFKSIWMISFQVNFQKT